MAALAALRRRLRVGIVLDAVGALGVAVLTTLLWARSQAEVGAALDAIGSAVDAAGAMLPAVVAAGTAVVALLSTTAYAVGRERGLI